MSTALLSCITVTALAGPNRSNCPSLWRCFTAHTCASSSGTAPVRLRYASHALLSWKLILSLLVIPPPEILDFPISDSFHITTVLSVYAAKEKGEKKLFGFSFVPLMQDNGRPLPDGTHELIVHKVLCLFVNLSLSVWFCCFFNVIF